jgi:hypothetical protein
MFSGDPCYLPYAIVDARLEMTGGGIAKTLAASGTRVIIDTQAWRFADERTWESMWASYSYAPPMPFRPSEQWVTRYAVADLRQQVELGGHCVLLPGWFASLRDAEFAADVSRWTLKAYRQFRRGGFLYPAIAWVPLSHEMPTLTLAAASVFAESAQVSAIYAQAPVVRGPGESLDVLARTTELMLDMQALGLPVIAGHMGATGLTLRALGVTAADCGPISSQSFNRSRLISDAQRSNTGARRSYGAPGLRMWVSELGQLATVDQMNAIRANRRVFSSMLCQRRCHRFRVGVDDTLSAVHHSLLSLIDDARDISEQPRSISVDVTRRTLLQIRSRVTQVNQVLADARRPLLRRDHLDVQLALLATMTNPTGVAS